MHRSYFHKYITVSSPFLPFSLPGASLSITETVIPVYKIRGEDAELNCHYDLEGDPLYSVKWYKDDEEFYRYMPGSDSHKAQSVFKRPGVEVDVSILLYFEFEYRLHLYYRVSSSFYTRIFRTHLVLRLHS